MTARATAAVLLVLLLSACAEEEPARAWYVSRFGGEARDWKLDIPRPFVPQKKPAMLIYEVSRYRDETPTAEQRAAADALREASMLAAVQRGWYDYESGRADGYSLMFSDGAHYVNEDYIFDDVVLDPMRPEFLMYYETSRGMSLVGFMFYVAQPNDRGEQIGGSATTWHYHVWSKPQCLLGGLLAVDVPDADGACSRGVPMHRSPEMLHVWLVDHPEGPFATRMQIRPDVLERLVAERGL